MESHGESGFDELGSLLAERLSLPADVLKAECERSESFRSLCEEFALCSDAADRWRASRAPFAEQRRAEYDETLADLGREIEEWLAQPNPGGQVSAG